MNKDSLRSYAPQARLDFIAAVTARANLLGITAHGVSPVDVRGDVALIDGNEWPAKIVGQRDELIKRIQRHGLDQTLEEIAYTWFNRFAALRYMELHDYLGHGWRVLSSRDGGLPEILGHASEVSLAGLDPARTRELQLAGNKDNELYKNLIVAQCNELSMVMPFLFERIDDDTELLLPEILLRTDSIVAKMVTSVPEADWKEIEVIGWLYQFYISDRKSQVIGKVVASRDIPAATQLFTPNWIVRYLVQNSLGKLWLLANPSSALAQTWTYHLPFADQGEDEKREIDELFAARARADGGRINPESITVLDPACGSGHILVVAYDALKAIYLESGYQPRRIPRLILEKNLFGLDIDDRAAQLAGFALTMKARADDRRLFDEPLALNVYAFQETSKLDPAILSSHLSRQGVDEGLLTTLTEAFRDAKTLGALMSLPSSMRTQLIELRSHLAASANDADMFFRQASRDFLPIVDQALVLCKGFDAVIANPPYMGEKYYCNTLSKFISQHYRSAAADIYACFMLACLNLCKPSGLVTNINIPGWMMNSTFTDFRQTLFSRSAIISLIHNGRGVFGSDFGSCAFTLLNQPIANLKGTYRRLFDNASTVQSNEVLANRFFSAEDFLASPSDFQLVDGEPLSYQVSQRVREAYSELPPISKVAAACQGLSTSDDPRFVRYWHEVSIDRAELDGSAGDGPWVPYNKGGIYRKWFGNIEHLIQWEGKGRDIKARKPKSVIRNERFYFQPSASWQDYTIGATSFRHYPAGFVFATNAHSAFVNDPADMMKILSFCNSKVLSALSDAVSPGLHFNSGYFNLIPFKASAVSTEVDAIASRAVEIAKVDWDSFERSWNFMRSPLVEFAQSEPLASGSYARWLKSNAVLIDEMRGLERKNNQFFIDVYGLSRELDPEVRIEDITLTINPVFRYGAKNSEADLARKFRENSAEELVSYAIGCIMGRFSLDRTGLVHGRGGNAGFDPTQYRTMPADADGILPITDEAWFEDDAASRMPEFLSAVWGEASVEANLTWLAEGLLAKPFEDSRLAIRGYLFDQFYKDHVQTYKKRPIYWLFSSGKLGAFQALVYQHRLVDGTLARMRSAYVLPLLTKMSNRIEILSFGAGGKSKAGERAKQQKQLDALRKKHAEVAAFDEKLRHAAESRISVNLDDGVKANYALFGDLLADSKAIVGTKDE